MKDDAPIQIGETRGSDDDDSCKYDRRTVRARTYPARHWPTGPRRARARSTGKHPVSASSTIVRSMLKRRRTSWTIRAHNGRFHRSASVSLTVDGELEHAVVLSLDQLKKSFGSRTNSLECGGNGRSEFRPKAKGTSGRPATAAAPGPGSARDPRPPLKPAFRTKSVAGKHRGADAHLSGDAAIPLRGVRAARQDETRLPRAQRRRAYTVRPVWCRWIPAQRRSALEGDRVRRR